METITNDPGADITQPIAPPVVHLRDTLSDEHILSTQWLKMPNRPKGQLQLEMHIEDWNTDQSQHLTLLCVIDSVDQPSRTIYVTLNKVYLNDVQQYPPPTVEAPPPVLPAPAEPPQIDTPPALPPEQTEQE